MKTLKFMLAVATAVGLASAAQAAQYTGASTGFEKLGQGTKVGSSVVDNDSKRSYFWYAGANADDNESEIVAATGLDDVTRPTGVAKFTGADAISRTNALQVSTGTDPLLRTFLEAPADGNLTYENLVSSTYVDTLVQFTVTPATDTTVTPSAADKLMIYLKETVTGENEDGTQITSTNLAVTAGYLKANISSAAKVYTAQNVSVKPGEWYRLTVEAIPAMTVNGRDAEQLGLVLFKIKINNTICIFDSMPCEQTAMNSFGTFAQAAFTKQVVLSLQASSSGANTKNQLQAVGFAGEGLVDDLVITTTDPAANVVNFTLVTGEGVGVVEYTIGGTTYWTNSDGKEIEDVPVGSTIAVVSVDYAKGYEFDSISGLLGLTAVPGSDKSFTVDANASAASLTINAKAQAPSGVVPGGEAVVVDTEEAANALAVSVTSPNKDIVSTEIYATYFKKVITQTGDGKYSVTAELDETVVKPDDTAADLVDKFDEISEAGVVTVKAKPGLYYSVKQGSSLGAMQEGPRTMATMATMATGETGETYGTVNLKATKFPGAGFYQIMVNFTDKQ